MKWFKNKVFGYLLKVLIAILLILLLYQVSVARMLIPATQKREENLLDPTINLLAIHPQQ